MCSCNSPTEHTAPAILERDSVPMMKSYGINTLISDSGVMKYRVISEQWEVNKNVNPQRQEFPRGVFLEQFDEQLHIEAYIQADTGYYFDEKQLWHLIGNVRVRTVSGLRFNSEELYWDQYTHELYSNKFSHVITPEREMQGSYFRSNEDMTKYYVSNSKGSFQQEDMEKKEEPKTAQQDTAQAVPELPKRQKETPRRSNYW